MFNLRKKKKQRKYLIDENLRINNSKLTDIPGCINSSRYFKPGTSDYFVIQLAKEEEFTLVTSDVRMTIMALAAEVPVIHINPTWKKMMCIEGKEFKCENENLSSYIKERLNK